MIEIPQAIQSLYPVAQFAGPANNGGYDKIRWHIKPDGITKEKIDAEVIRLQAEYDAQEYARNRVAEYPSNGDQWDMIYKDNLNSTTTHKDAVEAVKTKWPKNNTGPVE